MSVVGKFDFPSSVSSHENLEIKDDGDDLCAKMLWGKPLVLVVTEMRSNSLLQLKLWMFLSEKFYILFAVIFYGMNSSS